MTSDFAVPKLLQADQATQLQKTRVVREFTCRVDSKMLENTHSKEKYSKFCLLAAPPLIFSNQL